VNDAIIEVALLQAMQRPERSAEVRVAVFWDEVRRLRDLLKFEFFFKPTEEFREVVRSRLKFLMPDWEKRLVSSEEVGELLSPMGPMIAFAVLRPFVEAYGILARVLESDSRTEVVTDSEWTELALGLGKQLVLQNEIRSDESVSKLLFGTGLQLAANRGLLEFADTRGLARSEFAAELAEVGARVDEIEALTISAIN
jgi:glycerol-3-phosphate O-acyltransferase